MDAVPLNMHPEYNEGRRRARAKALAELHAGVAGARYVDAGEYYNERGFVVTVVDAEGNLRAAASIASGRPEEAEEVAIALASRDPGCTTVLSDSRQAIKNFSRGRVSPVTEKLL